MILQKSVTEVMERAQIEEVVRDFVNLKRRGSNMIGLCPFHNEKTPSFAVSPSKNIFKCFGCGQGGDPVRFIMELEKLSFPEAIRYLAKKYRIELEETEQTEEAAQEQQHLDSLYLTNQYAHDFFQRQLFETDRGKSIGLAYFKQRGYREETIRKFGLGFAPESGDAFTQEAVGAGYNIDLLRRLGLTSQYDRDFFRSRVMFSIHNLTGKVIAFAGRIMIKDAKAPKYINSPETEIYLKSKVLFGMYFAKKAIRQEDECILTEGYTDVISLHQNGIENVVASSGTSLTTEQIRLIKRFTNNIKILFDGDAAGIRAALRGLGMTLEEDLNVRLVVLPPGEDPDSYIQKVGVAAFQEYLKSESKDLIQFETELLLQEAGKDPTRRAAVLGEIAKTIAKVKNPLKRDEYVKICRETLQVDEGALVLEINRHLRRELDKLDQQTQVEGNRGVGEEPLPAISIPGPAAVTGDEFQEKDITRLLITSGAEWYDVAEELTVAEFIIHNIEDVLEEFDHPLYQRVILECRDRLDAHQPISQGYFTSHADEAIRQLAVGFLTSPYEYSENWANKWDIHLNQKHPEQNYHQDAENLLKRFKFRKLTRLIKRNQEKIKELAAAHSPELMAHLQLHQRLKDMHTDLAKDLGTVVF